MMKLTKREKTLVSVLVVVALMWANVYFIIMPQLEQIEQARIEQAEYEAELQKLRDIIASENEVDEEMTQLEAQIMSISDGYFAPMDQEEFILLMSNFIRNSDVEVFSVTSTQPQAETVQETEIDFITMSLTYEASYEALVELLRNIWGFQKQILVRSLSASSDDGLLSGTITLDMYRVPTLINEDEEIFDWYLDENNFKRNPFTTNQTQPEVRYILRSGELLLVDENFVSFVDIEGHWAASEIDQFARRGYVRGNSSHEFSPDANISRGEFILMLDRIFNWPTPEEEVDLSQFGDYAVLPSYDSDIAQALHKGIVAGYLQGHMDQTIRPTVPITYEEMESIMQKIFEDPEFQWDETAQQMEQVKGVQSEGLESKRNHLTKAEAVYFLYSVQ